MNEYQQQAADFCGRFNVTITWEYDGYRPYFQDDNESRDCWKWTLARNGITMSGGLGTSLEALYQSIRAVLPAHEQEAYDRGRKIRSIWWDGVTRAILARKERRPIPPTDYDLLACLTKSDPGTLENFCSEYGYKDQPVTEYSKVRALYDAVLSEWRDVLRVFGPEDSEMLAALREIA